MNLTYNKSLFEINITFEVPSILATELLIV